MKCSVLTCGFFQFCIDTVIFFLSSPCLDDFPLEYFPLWVFFYFFINKKNKKIKNPSTKHNWKNPNSTKHSRTTLNDISSYLMSIQHTSTLTPSLTSTLSKSPSSLLSIPFSSISNAHTHSLSLSHTPSLYAITYLALYSLILSWVCRHLSIEKNRRRQSLGSLPFALELSISLKTLSQGRLTVSFSTFLVLICVLGFPFLV